MGKAGLIAGKMFSGMAQVAVPAALQAQAAKIQAKRDERLQGYAQSNQTTQNEFVSGEGVLNRESQDKNTAATMAHTEKLAKTREAGANRRAEAVLEFEYDKFVADSPERQARLDLLGSQLEGSSLSNELSQLSLDSATESKRFLDLLNTATDVAERDNALEQYLLRNPKARQKITVTQLRDDLGNYSDEFAIFEGTQRVDRSATGRGSGTPKDAQAVKAAFQAGEMPGPVAESWLEYFESQKK